MKPPLRSVPLAAARRLVGHERRLRARLTARRRARQTLRDERLLVADIEGQRLWYPSSSVIGRAVADGAGWEPTLATVVNLVLPADEPLVVAEVGSNIGASLAQMIAVRPLARYVCFEPSQRFRGILLRNVAENGWTNVSVEPSLVGSRSETRRLFTNTSTASVASRRYGGHLFLESTEQRVVTLDDHFESAPRLDLIKSDTDGFDFDVLLGARRLLGRLRPALYFEYAPFLARRVGRSEDEILDFLDEAGYRTYLVFAQAGHLLALTESRSVIGELAERHRYVDVVTAVRADHLVAFPGVAAATSQA
jgi:FkbM family methyltransferase